MRSLSPELNLAVAGPLAGFVTDGKSADVELDCRWDELADEPGGEPVFDSQGAWALFRRDGRSVFQLRTAALGAVPYTVASLTPDLSRGEVRLHRPYFSGAPLYPLAYPLDELLLSRWLARNQGVEVHASGVVDARGSGHVFLGASGAGKTTLASLWLGRPGVRVLSDDRIALRKVGSSLMMYGTPWHGTGACATPASAPLEHLYFLHKGANRRLPVRRSLAVARLFACSFPPLEDAQGLEEVLGFLDEVAGRVPCEELWFTPDASALELFEAR